MKVRGLQALASGAAIALSFLQGAPLQAQTPAPVSLANDMRACAVDGSGFRKTARMGELKASLAQVPNRRWPQVTEIAPGVHRLANSKSPTVIEIKLPETDGTAHCVAFGPNLSAGQGALVADKFVELGFLKGFTAAPPTAGTTRRYVMQNAPYSVELIAYSAEGFGEIVGFSFAGVPKDLTTRAASSGDPDVTYQGLEASLTNAVNMCFWGTSNRQDARHALEQAGYELGFADGREPDQRTYFTPDNSVSVRITSWSCDIVTHYLSPSAALQITQNALNTTASGVFRRYTENQSGCDMLTAAGSGFHMPVYVNFYKAERADGASCTENGTSRITFGVAV